MKQVNKHKIMTWNLPTAFKNVSVRKVTFCHTVKNWKNKKIGLGPLILHRRKPSTSHVINSAHNLSVMSNTIIDNSLFPFLIFI